MRESSSKVKTFKNFKEKKSFKPEFGAEGIYGGNLLGVRAASNLSFYDWETLELIRRIEIQVKNVRVGVGRRGSYGSGCALFRCFGLTVESWCALLRKTATTFCSTR